jgi:Biotin-protein ligase, N terminal
MSHSSQQSAVQRSSSTGNPSLTNRLLAVAGSVALGLLVFVSMTGIAQTSHHHNNPAATPATQLTDIVDPTTTSSATTTANPIALVFRDNNGPAGCVDCSAGAATLLRSDRNYHFDVRFVGPHETLSVQAGLALPNVAIFVQPGGNGDVNQAFAEMAKDAPAIINFVKNGGMYLGFCEGGYLAGTDPGYNLLAQVGGDTDEYITSPGAVVTKDLNTVIPIIWRGMTREMFFEDGNFFTFSDGQGTPTQMATAGGATVLATYTNGEVAAVVAPYGKGIVAASGPHPEATLTWFKKYHLTPQSTADLGHDLVDTAMALRR